VQTKTNTIATTIAVLEEATMNKLAELTRQIQPRACKSVDG
jgi:hypothetical protein